MLLRVDYNGNDILGMLSKLNNRRYRKRLIFLNEFNAVEEEMKGQKKTEEKPRYIPIALFCCLSSR